MECKECGKLIGVSIEGELICSSCWLKSQQDEESRLCDAAISEYEQTPRYCEICLLPWHYHIYEQPDDPICPDIKCSACGVHLDEYAPDVAWRWTGDTWEHKCPDVDPQCGHFQAVIEVAIPF